MIRYRPFRNTDPPAIAEIWCSQPPQRGLVQPLTPSMLEHFVLAKPYFDRLGLIVAVEDDKPVGFVHAGFAAGDEGACLSFAAGTTCLLLVAPHPGRDEIAAELLRHSESYLTGRGARVLYGGSNGSLAGFYFGLYGGSRLAGVLASDTQQTQWFQAAGYLPDARAEVLQCQLSRFRPAVNREIMQLRRQCQLLRTGEVAPANWWEACTLGQIDSTCYELVPRSTVAARGRGTSLGTAAHQATIRFWDVEPLASSWGVHAMGLLDLQVDDAQQTHAATTTLVLGEAMREMQSIGVTLVEVQAAAEDRELIEVCHQLGFRNVDQAVQYRKPAPN